MEIGGVFNRPARPEIRAHPFSTRQGNFTHLRYCLFSLTLLRFLQVGRLWG